MRGHLPWVLAAAFALGIIVTIIGVEMIPPGSGGPPTAAKVVVATGLTLVIASLLIAAGWIAVAVISAALKERRRYRAWKATLTPEELNLVRMAEAAAMFATGVALHHKMRAHHKAVNARLTDTQVHGFGPPWDGTPRG
jgi:hypothetical protein